MSTRPVRLVDEAERRHRILASITRSCIRAPSAKNCASSPRAATSETSINYDSVRVNLGLSSTNVNVVWDLAVHDLSIMELRCCRFSRLP